MKRKVVNPNPEEKKLKQIEEKMLEQEIKEELNIESQNPPQKKVEKHREKMQHS